MKATKNNILKLINESREIQFEEIKNNSQDTKKCKIAVNNCSIYNILIDTITDMESPIVNLNDISDVLLKGGTIISHLSDGVDEYLIVKDLNHLPHLETPYWIYKTLNLTFNSPDLHIYGGHKTLREARNYVKTSIDYAQRIINHV